MGNYAELKERKKLFRIITILSFDDVLDSYRQNINYVIERIEMEYFNAVNDQSGNLNGYFNGSNNRQLTLAKMVFDLAGIT